MRIIILSISFKVSDIMSKAMEVFQVPGMKIPPLKIRGGEGELRNLCGLMRLKKDEDIRSNPSNLPLTQGED